MKIGIFHNLLSGGAKRTLYEFCQRLNSNHELWAYSLTSSNQDFADLKPLVTKNIVYDFKPGKLLRSPFGRFNQLVRLNDLKRLEDLYHVVAADMARQNFDLYFVNPSQFENSPALLRFLHGQPTVYFCQEPLRVVYEPTPTRPYNQLDSNLRKIADRIDPLPRIFKRALQKNDREAVRNARLVLVNSKYVQKAVQDIYQTDAHVNYPGVDAHFFRPLSLPKQNAVVSVGSLTPLKGFDFLVRSIGKISPEIRPPLWIASNFTNPPEQKYLVQLAQDYQVKLELFGGISDQRLVELYNQATVTVYAAVREPFGLVPIESMACGTPVVAVRDGGVQETVQDHITGRLVERDEDQFAAAIVDLLKNPELAREYGGNGRSLVLQQWTWEAATERLNKNFEYAHQNHKM